MDIKHEQEKNALGHYKNTEYYDKSLYINASMSKSTLKLILDEAGIDLSKCDLVLDFGCGTGETMQWLGENTTDSMITGIDYSRERMKVTSKNIQPFKERAVLITADVNHWLEGDIKARFDLILAFEIIEHLVDSDNVVDQLKKLLTPNGILLCTIPYQDKPNDIHLSAYKDQKDTISRLGVTPMKKFLMRFPNQNVFIYRGNK